MFETLHSFLSMPDPLGGAYSPNVPADRDAGGPSCSRAASQPTDWRPPKVRKNALMDDICTGPEILFLTALQLGHHNLSRNRVREKTLLESDIGHHFVIVIRKVVTMFPAGSQRGLLDDVIF